MYRPSGTYTCSNAEVVAPIDEWDDPYDEAQMGPEARRVTESRQNEKQYLNGLGKLIPIRVRNASASGKIQIAPSGIRMRMHVRSKFEQIIIFFLVFRTD